MRLDDQKSGQILSRRVHPRMTHTSATVTLRCQTPYVERAHGVETNGVDKDLERVPARIRAETRFVPRLVGIFESELRNGRRS